MQWEKCVGFLKNEEKARGLKVCPSLAEHVRLHSIDVNVPESPHIRPNLMVPMQAQLGVVKDKTLNLPWVCIGNFNEIAKVKEKSGGAIRLEKQMQDFRDCQDFCGLKDLGFTGLPFTWCNKCFNGDLIWVQLDRALTSTDWILKFLSSCLHHLQGLSFDHKPLWLASNDVNTHFYRAQKPFQFEAIWLKDDHCEDVVHSAWDRCLEGDAMGKVLAKVVDCQIQLKFWDKSTFGNIHIELAQKRKQLLKAEGESIGGRGHTQVKAFIDKIQKLMDKDEVMWHQRAKNDWLKFGDQNTKYFHCRATKRNKWNFIWGLENEQGS
ncbi:uncharacterized protein LOC115956561 [Quercus lobata]|uniref:uncharacterized protein LOC115956561 n=1 Tax=Quercus lobata TaxID=97700 RepID=UPI0012453E51|nr:uncharacterized protein LOC115956561 [Quercus lobata]